MSPVIRSPKRRVCCGFRLGFTVERGSATVSTRPNPLGRRLFRADCTSQAISRLDLGAIISPNSDATSIPRSGQTGGPRAGAATFDAILDAVDRGRWIERLAQVAIARPRQLFWWFVALHAAIWTLSSIALWHNLPDDSMEMVYWGREWQLGYYKLPPLPAWVAAIAEQATFGAHWTPLFVSQLFVSISFWAIWRFTSELAGEVRALLAVVALAGVASFGHEGMKFNHDVAQYPFWALTGWSLYRAVRGQRTRDWVLLGVWTGLGMMAKYQFVVTLLPVVLFVALHPASRATFRTQGPYVAIGIAAVIVAPNIGWLLAHDFWGPWNHAAAGLRPEDYGLWGHLYYPFKFAAGQASLIGCAIASVVALRGRADRVSPLRGLDAFDRWYVAVLALGPFLLIEAGQALAASGAKVVWGVSIWGFIGTFGVIWVARVIDRPSVRRFFVVTIALFAVVFVATALLESVIQPYQGRPDRVHFPGADMARRIDAGWREATNGSRLRYVVGDIWMAGNVAYYSADRPSVLIDANAAFSPWVDEGDLGRRGAVVIWAGTPRGRPPRRSLTDRFPNMVAQPPLVVPRRTWVPSPPAYIEWAIVPPSGD
jgi:hypothetical protein